MELPRLFVLEEGVQQPLDFALGPGTHELRDLGVRVNFDGDNARVTWLGFGPAAFLTPGLRQLRAGDDSRLADGDRVLWAGRQWRLFRGQLAGDDRAPPRGVCMNRHAPGHPLDAVLLLLAGKDRGNFFRVHSEPSEWAPGAWLRGVVVGDGVQVEVRGAVEIEPHSGGSDDSPAATATSLWLPLAAGALARAGRAESGVIAARVILPP